MNLEEYKTRNGLSTSEVVSLIQTKFPKFSKHQFSMIKRGIYGVVLDPRAAKVLNEIHPKTEYRARSNRVTVWMSDFLYALLISHCESTGLTKQNVCETALYAFLKPEAVKSEPAELNSRLQKELNLCRNELCLKCGNYREAHLGACDGCRWKEK